jgi:inhibitor of cysteine peptidase
VLVAIVLGATLVACGGSDDDGASGSAPVFHEGDSITVDDGQQFVIALTANPSTGYSWQAADNDKVTYLGSSQVNASNQAVGSSGTQELRFKATATGETTLDLAYSRPFEGGVPPAQTATFDVTIR